MAGVELVDKVVDALGLGVGGLGNLKGFALKRQVAGHPVVFRTVGKNGGRLHQAHVF